MGIDKLKIKTGRKLGEGGERKVYEDKDNPERVIGAFEYQGETDDDKRYLANQARGRFYLSKILHLLYPDNIRDIHGSFSDPNATINKRVRAGVRGRKNEYFKDGKEKDAEIHGLRYKIYAETGANLDGFFNNFMYDQSGNLVYVDTPDSFTFDIDKLRTAVEKLEGDKKVKGLLYLERLIVVRGEEYKKNDDKKKPTPH